MRMFGTLFLAAAAAIFVSGPVLAQDSSKRLESQLRPQRNVAAIEQRSAFPGQRLADYDSSGSRGRMGLGADGAYPEGPGNFSF